MFENLGGMVENAKNKRSDITPENRFRLELLSSYRFLDSFISRSEFDSIYNSLEKFKFFTSMNPNLILLGFIAFRGDMTIAQIMRDVSIHPIIDESKITGYDIIRYKRYYERYLPYAGGSDKDGGEDFYE